MVLAVIYSITLVLEAEAQCIYIGEQYVCLPAVTSVSCTDCLGTTQIADSYVLNTGDTLSGQMRVTGTMLLATTTGKVGIGTGLPGYLMEVNGSLQADAYYSVTGSLAITGTVGVKGTDGNNCIVTFKSGLYITDTCP